MRYLSVGEKLALINALLALQQEYKNRKDLHEITMGQWLQEKKQPQRVIDRFWRQILVSAINEELDRMAAVYGFQVFWLGFLATKTSYEMGVPAGRLGDLLSRRFMAAFSEYSRTSPRLGQNQFHRGADDVSGKIYKADYYISALPFERAAVMDSSCAGF